MSESVSPRVRVVQRRQVRQGEAPSAATAKAANIRSQHARHAAQVRWAKEDPVLGTQRAREAFHDKFYRQVDAWAAENSHTLTPAERHRRAVSAKKAYMTRLAMKSARARRG